MGLKSGRTRSSLRNVQVGDGIPDSGDYQWYVDEGSGTTLNPDVGSVSQTVNGATWQSLTSATGTYYIQHDGTDDSTQTDSNVSFTTQWTLFGWLKLQIDTSSSFNETIWHNTETTNEQGWEIQTEAAEELISVVYDPNDSNPGTSVNRNVSWVSNGNWGFFAIIRDGADLRMITWSNSAELEDTGAITADQNPGTLDDNFEWGDGRSGHMEMGLDFHGYAESNLTKSTLTDLWEATKR